MIYAEKRKRARKLRRGGASYSEIQKELHIAKSTLSTWVSDIELSDDQRRQIKGRKKFRGSNESFYRNKRRAYQDAGREMARSIPDKDFVIGCMLYWAEGGKGRNMLQFSNSDPEMVKVFIRFLDRFFAAENISTYVQCYDGNGLNAQDVETFWADVVGRGPVKVRMKPASKTGRGSKANKRPHGCCYINLCKTEAVQKLFGAIQELTGIERPEWLD